MFKQTECSSQNANCVESQGKRMEGCKHFLLKFYFLVLECKKWPKCKNHTISFVLVSTLRIASIYCCTKTLFAKVVIKLFSGDVSRHLFTRNYQKTPVSKHELYIFCDFGSSLTNISFNPTNFCFRHSKKESTQKRHIQSSHQSRKKRLFLSTTFDKIITCRTKFKHLWI